MPNLPEEYTKAVETGGLNQPSIGITRRFAGGKQSSSSLIETIGDNTLITPAAGKRIVLYWIALVTPEANTAEVLAQIKLGTLTPYQWYLGKPGAFMHWEPITGAVDATLVVNLSAAQKVAASYTYTEG